MRDSTDLAIETSRKVRPHIDTVGLGVRMRVDRLASIIRDDLSDIVAERGFSVFGDYQLVNAVRRARTPVLPTQLADALMLTRAGVTGRLDRLEAAGFIRREPGEDDARTVLVRCTALGRRRVDAAAADIETYERRLLQPLTASEVDELARLLKKILVSRDPDPTSD